jgi:Ankyrin repeats (3 copies)/Ankyrin repeat
MSTDWGPPGLETPTSRIGATRLTAAAVCLMVAIGIPWCHENVGSIDLMTGNRNCGAAPSAIRVWSGNYLTPRPEEAGDLRKWIARHPNGINNQYGARCDTALHSAARFGRADLADLLIAAGANVEAPNEYDEQPLHTAATYGRASVVKLLLSSGADVNARGPGGKTPLHAAAFGVGQASDMAARVEVATLLLAAGADVNAREPGSGFMPLRYATPFGSRHTAMADLLVSQGADPRGAESEERRSPERLPPSSR